MRAILRTVALASILGIGGVLGLGTSTAEAQGYGGCNGGYRQGYGYRGYAAPTYATQGYASPGYAAQGYRAPTQNYYGNGGHDYQPHWHSTQTPGGSFAWYGNGAHDAQAHEHTNSPYGGYRGYSPSPFGGVTTSYYNSTPYTYMPW